MNFLSTFKPLAQSSLSRVSLRLVLLIDGLLQAVLHTLVTKGQTKATRVSDKTGRGG